MKKNVINKNRLTKLKKGFSIAGMTSILVLTGCSNSEVRCEPEHGSMKIMEKEIDGILESVEQVREFATSNHEKRILAKIVDENKMFLTTETRNRVSGYYDNIVNLYEVILKNENYEVLQDIETYHLTDDYSDCFLGTYTKYNNYSEMEESFTSVLDKNGNVLYTVKGFLNLEYNNANIGLICFRQYDNSISPKNIFYNLKQQRTTVPFYSSKIYSYGDVENAEIKSVIDVCTGDFDYYYDSDLNLIDIKPLQHGSSFEENNGYSYAAKIFFNYYGNPMFLPEYQEFDYVNHELVKGTQR